MIDNFLGTDGLKIIFGIKLATNSVFETIFDKLQIEIIRLSWSDEWCMPQIAIE